jgi:Na+-driven multidrug efflux pump
VTGAAVATCAAPFVSVCVAVYIILSGRTIIRRPPKFTPLPSWGVTKTVVRIGFPTGMLGTMLNASGVAVFWFIGSLEDGELAQNAYTLCYTQLFSAVQWASWALRNTASSLIGQNIGAGKTDRGIRAVYVTTGVALCWALIMGTLYFTIPKALLGLFSVTDPAVLAYGAALLRFLAFSGLFLIGALALTGGLIGAGDTRTPMAIAFFSQIIVLLGTCFVCYQLDALTAKVIWASILVSHAMRFALTAFAFWREGWRGIDVTVEDENGDGKEHMADAIAQETAAREDGA